VSSQRQGGERRIGELNWLGKAVYLVWQGVRYTTELIDSAIDVAAETYAEAERAFKIGLDPRIDEATILEERTREEIDRDPESNSG